MTDSDLGAADSALTPLDKVQAVVREAMRVSPWWTALMLIAALISAFHVNVTTRGDFSGSFAPSTLSGVLVALVWLPALLRVIALAGGGVKTPAGEATTGGLLSLIGGLSAERKREALPPLLAALSDPQVLADPGRRSAAEPVRRNLELQFASAALPTTGIRERLAAYAARYEQIRSTDEPSDERTYRMTTLMAEARAIAQAAPLPFVDVRHMLENGTDGERVIALGLAQDRPDPRLLDLIVGVIGDSRSAFEQYQALGAALELVPMLLLDTSAQAALKKALKSAVQNQRNGIEEDSSRLALVRAIQTALA
jgi:hypothetical protein